MGRTRTMLAWGSMVSKAEYVRKTCTILVLVRVCSIWVEEKLTVYQLGYR